MNEKILFESGKYGIKAIINGSWQDSYLNLLLKKEVKELELNDGKGWRGDNIDFIKSLPDLKSLVVIDFKLKSLEAIHSLRELVRLQIATYSKIPVNFKSFPNLIVCDFEWISGSDTLFECKKLISLGLNRYDNTNSALFSNLINLERLSIMNSKILNLEGLSQLKKLNYLSIANLKSLDSLKGIEDLYHLEELEIQKCKGICSISEILGLSKLRKLLLIDLGQIDTLKGLENLKDLTMLMFYESTNIIDGNLFPITKLDNLTSVSFQNRKHYSHKREDFGKLFTNK